MFRLVVLLLLWGCALKVFSQEKNQFLHKLDPSLRKLVGTKHSGDSISISLSAKEKISFVSPHPVNSHGPFFYRGKINPAELGLLVQNEAVLFISQQQLPKEEINTGASDPTLNLINFSQQQFPQVRGETVATSLKERAFDTTDIDLKGRIFRTGLENATVTTHASLMATIMAGAGNSSPFAKGAAPAARVSSSSFSNLFPDDALFRTYGISLQNHSYGTIVENFYGNEAAAYDQNAVSNPALLHVFSAGNAGNSTSTSGIYTGITEMANLTGNFKQAKNSITVSGVDSIAQLLPLSSKGPAYDGRIKPDLVAYGEDGSSGAAALTSGAVILVQDSYRQRHNNTLPSSALTKAILLNSADDVGETYPDYLSGYGNLNAYRATQTVQDNRFFQDRLEQGSTTQFSIPVPPNAIQLKVTLVWNDLPATPNAAKALVNDLDMVVRSPSGESWLPWVLDPNPNRNTLLLPAQRKVDTLNNVEQISIHNPTSGMYVLEVSGTRIVSPNQAFALAWQVDTANTFYWTYPSAADQLSSGRRHTIRWQTTTTGTGKIEYTTDGFTWKEAGIAADMKSKSLKWTVPGDVTTARLRMISGTAEFVSDTFTINPPPSLRVGFTCADSFLLYWNKSDIQQYRLYQLGERYLEPALVTSDTATVLSKIHHPSLFYSIAPLFNGLEGLRSHTINYTTQGVGCYLRSFYLQSQTATSAFFIAELGSVYQVAEVRLEQIAGNRFVTIQTIMQPQTTRFSFADIPVQQGENLFRLVIKLSNGKEVFSDVETVYAVSETVPVIFYPNPVAQSSDLKILTREVGRYTVLFFDATGRQAYKTELTSTITTVAAGQFAKGMYFIRIVDKDGKAELQKQVVF